MSDSSQGEGWWHASDGKWYPAEQHPDYKPPLPPPPAERLPPPPDAPPPPAAAPDPKKSLIEKTQGVNDRAKERAAALEDRAAAKMVNSSGEFTLKVREDGKNGEVTVGEKGITRVIAKRIGKDDRQFIPYAKIHMVEHNRKSIGTDIVVLHVGSGTLEWKVAMAAERFVDMVNERIG